MRTQGLNLRLFLPSTLLLMASPVFCVSGAIAQTSSPSPLPDGLSPVLPSAPPSSSQFTSSFRSRSNPLFENLTLTPNRIGSSTTVRGISGGTLSAAQVAERAETATGSCVGFVDTQPDHVLVLTEAFNGLSLQVQSAEDTTLLVKGPGGSWCNDNYTSANPGIAGQWLPGTYAVWVGSQRSTGYFPYVIRIFEIASPPGLPPILTAPPVSELDESNRPPETTLPTTSDAPPDNLPSSSPGDPLSDLPSNLPNP